MSIFNLSASHAHLLTTLLLIHICKHLAIMPIYKHSASDANLQTLG
jgi:hypothetical protein